MLKGKCKIDFSEFLLKYYDSIYTKKHILQLFEAKLPEEKQGVLLEFFRGKGIRIGIFESRFGDNDWRFAINDNAQGADASTTWDYSTAFTHAINKACEIINNQNK